jgi:hypothetical protein
MPAFAGMTLLMALSDTMTQSRMSWSLASSTILLNFTDILIDLEAKTMLKIFPIKEMIFIILLTIYAFKRTVCFLRILRRFN